VHGLLSDLVKAVVKQPEKVVIKHTAHGPLDAFGVKVDPDDIRRVIGAKGKHFKALQHIAICACKMLNREGFIAVEEETVQRPPAQTSERVFVLNQGRSFAPVRGLLERAIGVFVPNPKDFTIEETSMGTTHIFHVRANASAFNSLTGETAIFDYGPDGVNIGAIKNLFDAISKNHGKIVKIILSKQP